MRDVSVSPAANPPHASSSHGWQDPDFGAIVRSSTQVVARFDASGRLVFLNPAADALLGSTGAWAGRCCDELVEEQPVFGAWSAPVRRACAGETGVCGEAEIRVDAQSRVLRFRAVPERAPGGAPYAVLVYGEDVTEQRTREARLSHSATYDALCGVYNREAFLHRLRAACAARSGAGAPGFAVLFVDLDRFKLVNDRVGHAGGDAVLRIVGKRLLSCVRPTDVVGRLGGDEFAVLLLGVDEVRDGVAAVGRIQQRLAEPMEVEGAPEVVTASVGLVLGGESGDPEAILAGADRAMYFAKELGEGHYQVVDSGAAALQSALESLDEALLLAIEENQLTLHYQPIVSLDEGRVVGLEALVRWNHPERGLIGPQAFLPVAEQSGRIADVDRWVLRAAAVQLGRWSRGSNGPAMVPVSVNLSARIAGWPELVDFIAGLLAEQGLPATMLAAEITETALLELNSGTVTTFSRLARTGVRLALDDFGTGYSSLSHLRHLPLDTLTIDRTFVSRMVEDATDRAIVGSVLMLARSLGLRVVAEGIESAEQRDVLRELGCDRGQGFLFGRAVDADAAEALLAVAA